MPPPSTQAERWWFFTGKGGVGKTTCAAASSLALAERGHRVLVASTDPAHSLGDALGQGLTAAPTRVRGAGPLWAVELDADRALSRWVHARRDVLALAAERGTYLDQEDIEGFLALAFPGIDALFALLELMRWHDALQPEHVVVDTAPTGHTLRLLQSPRVWRRIGEVIDQMQAKHRVMRQALGGAHRADQVDALIDELNGFSTQLTRLVTDPDRARFRWVTLAEPMSIDEMNDGLDALDGLGAPVEDVIVNRVLPPGRSRCPHCRARRSVEARALRRVAQGVAVPVRVIAEAAAEPRGWKALAAAGRQLHGRPRAPRLTAQPPGRGERSQEKVRAGNGPAFIASLPEGLRLLVWSGKGGVGKTSCAAASALALARARPRHRVLLLSVDPAPSLGDALGMKVGDETTPVPGFENLWARELDADAVFAAQRARYQAAVDALFDGLRGASRLDAAYDRAILRDLIELAPPGLDELMGLFSMLDAIFPVGARSSPALEAAFDLVVLDTAPTGHTEKLLALPHAAAEWVRALLALLLKYRQLVGLGRLAEDLVLLSKQLRAFDALLRDPTRCRVVAVTRAGRLPREETLRWVRTLHALGVRGCDVLINAVTPGPRPGARCAGCSRRAALERAEHRALIEGLVALRRRRGADILAPASYPSPHRPSALLNWCHDWSPP